METNTQSFNNKRKFLVVLPVLVLPFITFAFWALGGGRNETMDQTSSSKSGFNLALPDANLNDEAIDKLGFYDKAAADSMKLEDQIQSDPYFKNSTALTDTFPDHAMEYVLPHHDTSNLALKYTDPNEERVYNKINQLNEVMNSNKSSSELPSSSKTFYEKSLTASGVDKQSIDRLDQMMQNMNQDNAEDDPEMKQVDKVLEKILDIQHPERITEKIKQNSLEHKREVYPVVTNNNAANNYFFSNRLISASADSNKQNDFVNTKFYSVEDKNNQNDILQNTIGAVIQETQSLVSGSTIKLRLLNNIYINGMLIPKNNFIYGVSTLEADRLNIRVSAIRFKNFLLPVELSVYDMDGLKGIYIPGSITKDVANQASENALQNLGSNSLNTSITEQAISAGIDAGKHLISKKYRLIKVTVKAGYKVLLKNSDEQ